MIHVSFAAVLTGDIVSSRKVGDTPVNAAFDALRATAKGLADDADCDHLFARHRGDGWQAYFSDGGLGLRAALRLQAAVMSLTPQVKTRIAIGLGPAAFSTVNDLASASGAAFEASGETLDKMPRGRLIDIARTRAEHALNVHYADTISQKWSGPRAQAILAALRPTSPTQDKIAEDLGVTRQAVQKRLSETGLDALLAGIAHFEGHIATTWEPSSD